MFKSKRCSTGIYIIHKIQTFHWACQSLERVGSCTGMGKLGTVLYTHAGTDYTLASGSCVEWCSLKYKQLPLSCTPSTELEMITQEACLHSCRVSFAFTFHVDFIKQEVLKEKGNNWNLQK